MLSLPDSKIDLARAFAQIRMSPQDQQKTAIATPFGLYEYTRMPFGLRNAAQTFQRLMDSVFRGLPRVFVYIDGILVLSRITIRPDIRIFGKPQIQFLGFQLSDSSLTPLPDKVNDLTNLPPPRNVPDCRRFLGMLNYYHHFICNLASTLLPLHQLANQPKRQPFQWIPGHDAAFQEAKRRLAQAATLAFPYSQAPTQVIADASDSAVDAVIQQRHDNRWVPFAFHSKKLSPSQLKWSTGDKELFALFSAVKRFRHLLEGQRDLQFCTDHKPLTYAFTAKSERSARVQRQLAFLSEFSTNIRHIGGANNVVSDCPSRPPH
uniref:RNA-directed DNA polymerase n=1 Tax=Trichuris muris TaxID=70415 RepID=A0A5S6Q4P4_TRIMR